MTTPDQTAAPVLEIAHVMFMDIVSYSKLPMDQQQHVIKKLQEAVRSTRDFQRAHEREQLIRLPTGDGMALVFFGDPESAARCAVELSRILKQHPEIPLRIGLHTGPVYRIADINANRNVSGGGINLAQRVMDCGDAGHILVSATVAEMLGQLSNWADSLHELGEAEVKHGVKVHVFNLYTREVGNPAVPARLAGRRISSRPSGAAGTQAESLAGQTVGNYRVLRTLGSGGMGVVYEAEDVRLHRHVALKFMPEHFYQDPLAMERFRREATLASSLNHPNICTLHDIGEEDGRHFIVLELLEGEPLKARIDRGPVALEQVVEWGIQIADALDAAHSAGVVHRDVKPANIFITRREAVKIVDFGLAKLAAGARAAAAPGGSSLLVTSPGTPLGTVAYMSPEQARGQELDARTDIFSLGIVLYEMATGRSPFAGTTTAVVFDAILNKPAPPISHLNPALPPGLQKIVARALQKDREARYRSAAELRDELKLLRGPATAKSGTVRLAAPGSGARLGLLAGMAAIAVVAAAVGGWLWKRSSPPPPVTPATVAQPSTAPAQPASLPPAAPAAGTAAPAPRPLARPAREVETTVATAHSAAPAAPSVPARETTSPVPGVTGQFSGRLKNLTMGAEAAATLTLGDARGAVTGCLQVSRPLGGSGGLSGVATGNTVLLNTVYAGGRIEFRGQLSGSDELRGTYTVFAANGRIEQGSFTFARRSSQGPPPGFDPRTCPKD